MMITATDFKAKCLAILDQVHAGGETVTITKRGKPVALLVPPPTAVEQRWLGLRGSVTWHGDPFAPAVRETDIEAYK